MIPVAPRRAIPQIAAAIEAVTGVTWDEIVGPKRQAHITWSRHTAMLLVRERTMASYPELAEIFDRDHTTVMNGVRQAQTAMRADLLSLVRAELDYSPPAPSDPAVVDDALA